MLYWKPKQTKNDDQLSGSPSADEVQRTSKRKAEANRQNSKKSTGPKTERGKRRSSYNALKHGALARSVPYRSEFEMWGGEKFASELQKRYGDYEDLRTEMQKELALIDYWRLIRGLAAEESPLEQCENPAMPELIIRYNKANRRSLMKTLDRLEEARGRRICSSSNSTTASHGECIDSEETLPKKPVASAGQKKGKIT
jgi:hypothetical protein